MLKRIQTFFEDHLTGAPAQRDPEHALRLAAAALLLEMTRMDQEIRGEERAAVAQAVREHFRLDPLEAEELIGLAEEERENSTDYFQFTSLLNRAYTPEQKVDLIELLWRIAYADAFLHRHEEHLVRKIADLLYVPHGAFIAAKHRVAGGRR
jgi:uncharacterized tellurite resistance protein B-like protein